MLLPSLLLAATAVPAPGESPEAWREWGGPSGDFRAPAGDLARSWPESGPPELWRRPLDDGYSAILFEDGRLYSMARSDEREVVFALDAGTGETVWEYRYQHSPYENQRGYGVGPRSTPLIAGSRLFTIGITGKMHALSKRDGAVLWSRELLAGDFRGSPLSHGYSSSPAAWKDLVIVPIGGEDSSLVAFEQATGEVRWRSLSFANSYSSPRIVEIAGEPQLLAFMTEELIGVDPDTGALLWRYAHGNQWGHNVSTPLVTVAPEGRPRSKIVFVSSPQVGSRGFELARDGEGFRLEELWANRRIQLYHGSTAWIDDWAYGSSGVTAPALMSAINIRTGEIGWRQRGFSKANVVEVDGQLLILDEDGMLYLATATPDALEIHAKTQLLDRIAWTPPTVVGRTLYARDRTQIVAVDLGKLGSP